MNPERLRATVAAVCPIVGLSVTGQQVTRIDYAPGATDQQKAAAQQAAASFDWSDAAEQAWLESQQPERTTLRQAAQQAVADNQTYLAISNPSNAQVVAQARRLTQQNIQLIKRLAQL